MHEDECALLGYIILTGLILVILFIILLMLVIMMQRWYRTLMNLGFHQTKELVRLARFIRYGVLSSQEASLVFYDRLAYKKKSRYLLMIYWIDDNWLPEVIFILNLLIGHGSTWKKWR